ncbi:MAG: hypothetical protein KC414_03730, partial [Romboutsia sp.]|nr:hypothetical protein [Romboutsia sp.]
MEEDNFAIAQNNFKVQNLVDQSKFKSNLLESTISNLQNKYGNPLNNTPKRGGWDFVYTPQEDKFRKYQVKQSDIYTQLNSGELVSKYENYIHGVDNADRLSKTQSGFEKWTNGITKFVGKTTLNILDGTMGTVNGLAQGLSEGSFSAVYNNDFSKWVDDMNTRMDYQLPNYKSVQERDMNFLQSMGTANFWADDFLGGMSFMLGTMGSEALWALATGGASLPSSIAKVGFRLGAKTLLKEGAEGLGKAFLKNPSKLMKAYNRTIPLSTAGKIFNNTRFLYTSAGYEAGVEARHSLNESIESFYDSYQNSMNRMPTNEEYSSFMDDAVSNANKVFAANVALVGASNLAQFGGYFGVGTGMSKAMSNAVGKTFGLGFKKTFDAAEKRFIAEALNPNKFQRITGSILRTLESPFIEGFVEEGGQSVISNTSKKWLASRYNPDSLQENYSFIDAATDSFKETYGTKEGFKEVGLGMLIGFVGSAGKRSEYTGKRTMFGIGDFAQEVVHNKALAEQYNIRTNKFTQANDALLKRLVTTNQFNTFLRKSNEEANKGDNLKSSIYWDASQYSKMLIEDQAGMLEDSIGDFKRVMENTSTEELMDKYNLSEEQVENYKEAMINNYTENVALFKKAKGIAEALQSPNEIDYKQELGLNIYLGTRAGERASEIADTIEEILGTTGTASALRTYTNLNKRQKRAAERMVNLELEIGNLEKEYSQLEQSFSSSTNKAERVETAKGVTQELDKLDVKRNKLYKKLQDKRNELSELESKTENRFYISKFSFNKNLFKTSTDKKANEQLRSEFVVDEDLKQSVRSLQELDSYRKLLREEDPQSAEQLDFLLNEYVKNVKAFRDFNIVYEKMADPKFAKNSYKGVTKLFKNIGTDYKETEFSEALDYNKEQFDAFMEGNKDSIDENNIFTLETLFRMNHAFAVDTKV